MKDFQSSTPVPVQVHNNPHISALGHHSPHFIKDKHWMPAVMLASFLVVTLAVVLLTNGYRVSPRHFWQALSGPVIRLDEQDLAEPVDSPGFSDGLDEAFPPVKNNSLADLAGGSGLSPAR